MGTRPRSVARNALKSRHEFKPLSTDRKLGPDHRADLQEPDLQLEDRTAWRFGRPALGRRLARHSGIRFAEAFPNLQTFDPPGYPTAPDFCMLSYADA